MAIVLYKIAPLGHLDYVSRLSREPLLSISLDAPATDPGYIVSMVPRPVGRAVFVYEIWDGDTRVWAVNRRRYGLEDEEAEARYGTGG